VISEGPSGKFGFRVEKSIPRLYWRNPGLKQATEELPGTLRVSD
jgi:hypothetical protein